METSILLSKILLVVLLCACFLFNKVETVFLPLPTEIGESFEFDLQLTVPYTIVMPTWVGRRRKRKVTSMLNSAEERVMDAYKMSNIEGVIATRMESMFSHLGIDETSCQKRLLCLVSQDPEKYAPLSDIILQHLVPLHSHLMSTNINSSSTMWRYIELYEAGKKGISLSTNCTHETIDCSKHPDHGIDWSIISVWQMFMKFIKIRFN